MIQNNESNKTNETQFIFYEKLIHKDEMDK